MKKGFGFTLMEMIVALGVFSVAITIALAGFVNILDMQKRADAIRTAYDSIDFVMEAMSREIKTGTEYCTDISAGGPICGGLNNPFYFSTSDPNNENKTIIYRLTNNKIEIAVTPKNFTPTTFVAFTPPEVKITKLEFDVTGYFLGDSIQPMVTVIIQAEVAVKQGAKVQLNLQTTVTQREIDS